VSGLVPVRETAPRLLTFAMKIFREEAVGLGEGGGSHVREGGGYALCKGMGRGLDLAAKKRLEAKGRDDGVFISWFPSLTTAVAEAPFVSFFLFPGPEPAAGA